MDEDRPRVSAVITAYNSAAFIDEAIESVLAQTHPVDEIVIVDDGSTDDTHLRAAAYASAGVRYIFQKNQGAGAARNRGIAETTGELITFLDSDDIWLPDKIGQQVEYLNAHSEMALVSGAAWWWDAAQNERWLKPVDIDRHTAMTREIVVRNFVGNPSKVMVRRAVLEVTGPFDPTLRWGQDWELWIRIIRQAPIGFISAPLIIYRWHEASLSHYKQWERLSLLLEISRRAITSFQPAWRRPLLWAQAWSSTELARALYARQHQFAWRRQLWHAGRALCAYPFDNAAGKVKLLGRILSGDIHPYLKRGYKNRRSADDALYHSVD